MGHQKLPNWAISFVQPGQYCQLRLVAAFSFRKEFFSALVGEWTQGLRRTNHMLCCWARTTTTSLLHGAVLPGAWDLGSIASFLNYTDISYWKPRGQATLAGRLPSRLLSAWNLLSFRKQPWSLWCRQSDYVLGWSLSPVVPKAFLIGSFLDLMGHWLLPPIRATILHIVKKNNTQPYTMIPRLPGKTWLTVWEALI